MDNKSVSILIPVRNEAHYIGRCLDSILRQTYPKELIETLVIDGKSDDETREVIKTYIDREYNIKLLDNEKKIVPTGMNIGLKEAKGDIIIRLDGHSYVEEDFATQCVEKLDITDADCVGGPIDTVSSNHISRAISLAMSSPFGIGNALFRYAKKETYVDTLAFGAYRREVFDRIGNFDEELIRSQDSDLNYRIIKNGGKILLSPDIKSHYYSRSSLKKLWRQYYQYGFWKVRVMQKHKRPTAIRQLIPTTFILSVLITLIGSVFGIVFKYLLLGIVLSYSIISLVISIISLFKSSLEVTIYLPIVFAILHISYGLGFLNGILTFYVLKEKSSIKKNSKLSR